MQSISGDHRARIVASLPSGVMMSDEAWAHLEEIVTGFLAFQRRRATYPIKAERLRWMRNALDTLAAELRWFTASAPDLGWPNRALAALWEVNQKVESREHFHATWSAFSGTKNPYNEFLYWGVLRVWTDRLGGKLRYSMSPEGAPSGPLVRFFLACVEPVLDDRTPRAGLAGIINRERDARTHTEAEKKRRGL
jgi:hypothetical protein